MRSGPRGLRKGTLPLIGADGSRYGRAFLHRRSELSNEFHVRVVSGSPIPETEPNDGCSASAALQRLGGRVIGPATAKNEVFAITVNANNTIGGSWALIWSAAHPVWKVIAAAGYSQAPSS